MVFKRIDPSDTIRTFIECYWIIEDEAPIPVQQKIVPDGFPEIIFHYGDPYKILIANEWELQADFLLAGQITKFFLLKNAGKTGVFAIKLKPAAVYQLFNFSMEEYNDKVVSLNNTKNSCLKRIKQILSLCTHEETLDI